MNLSKATGQKIGYVRVSSIEQNPDRQINILSEIGMDKIFLDKESGKDIKRLEFQNMMGYVRSGDSIYVTSMDRLARKLSDLNYIVDKLNEQNIKIIFIKEGFSLDGNETSVCKLMFHIFSAFAEFERSVIKERQREGIELAKLRGVYKGRKPSLTDESFLEIALRVQNGEKVAKICREFKISRETYYTHKKSKKNLLVQHNVNLD